ncbi:MAG: hypothetical protein Q8907_10095 [Bacteroidota bacterium]|nr:hypothetical protein [Bacteroidota bacterium]MDP4274617.1 hypothetical protein [Bacteroidota bacterium]
MKNKFKNEIFNYLSTIGLGVERFELKDDNCQTEIILKDSPLKFIIGTSPESYNWLDYQFVAFSPDFTLSNKFPETNWDDFKSVFDGFKNWIKYHVEEYIEDIQTDDLWSEYNKGNKTLSFREIEFKNQENFSLDEKAQIKLAINDLKQLIHKSLETTEEEQILINNRLEYLIDAVNRLNKFDWKSVAISTIINISITLTLDTTKGQLLWELFKKVFNVIPILIK